MPAFIYTPKTGNLAKKYSLSPNELAFVDLCIAGFDKRDAYIIAMHMGESWTPDALDKEARLLLALPGSKQRIRESKSGVQTPTDEEDQEENIIEALSKDNMLKDLYYARKKMKRGSKEWLDVNKMIADITRMKQEEVKTEDTTVHFYLPLTCHRCSLYAESKKQQDKHGKQK